MGVFHWFKIRFGRRGQALARYRRGMVRAKKHDHEGAIEDYTATIGMTEVPADVKAMALYNRALVHVAIDHESEGIADLNAVLAMEGARENVKTMARQKLAKMESRTRKSSAS